MESDTTIFTMADYRLACAEAERDEWIRTRIETEAAEEEFMCSPEGVSWLREYGEEELATYYEQKRLSGAENPSVADVLDVLLRRHDDRWNRWNSNDRRSLDGRERERERLTARQEYKMHR